MLKVINLLAHLSGVNGLVGGQVLDIKSSQTDQCLKTLNDIHHKKTGALFTFCLTAPAILNSANQQLISLLEDFSQHLGLLFQITDDILDVTGNKASLGKIQEKINILIS